MQESKKDKPKWTFPISNWIKVWYFKTGQCCYKTMNNNMAYETTSKQISMRISLTKDPVFEAIMTGGGSLCPAGFSILLLNPTTLTRVYREGTWTPVQPQ